ncbi:hypothetical protein HPP92_005069 [Vanilla planifolia]|uniref:Uncharacterized protein n=1 Tax=Vanilla planifolia TaxID=51239 RepID=A0A835RKP2_VANPL|nr:hypothetical protein HPP92_005069 [Vanilla planifolia]
MDPCVSMVNIHSTMCIPTYGHPTHTLRLNIRIKQLIRQRRGGMRRTGGETRKGMATRQPEVVFEEMGVEEGRRKGTAAVMLEGYVEDDESLALGDGGGQSMGRTKSLTDEDLQELKGASIWVSASATRRSPSSAAPCRRLSSATHEPTVSRRAAATFVIRRPRRWWGRSGCLAASPC